MSKSPAVTISAIRGRARAAGSELALATTSASPAASGPSSRYGYVNRAIPDADFPDFVDAFAERVSHFDLLALADIKRFVNAASLPADGQLTAEMDALIEAFARPATPSILEQALKDGFQQDSPMERALGAYINQVRAQPGTPPSR